ncbi:SRPBCC family protein [Salinisphaera sp.]|uniref:SRPBCC family protein n=1 Tax=Salinisphaera sp. TaxID=1914330 RepID=UPI002D78929C|nr:SRPBCC family protein [Salinisphaera sp.]HET7312993.1 SRPBCC family protein [Salinisphaera sp.]
MRTGTRLLRSRRVWLVGGLILTAGAAHAASIERLHVDHEHEAYRVTARVHIAAPAGPAYAAAIDFERLPDYSAMIESTRLIGADKLASRMRLCVLWYCKTLRQVMRYRLDPPKRIDMTVVPGRGDLSSGNAHWRFKPDGEHATELEFRARIVPDLWVPPLIGPWAIARALREQVVATATAIERLAQHRDDANDKPTP